MQVIRLPNGRFQEAFITVPALGFEEPAALFQRLQEFLTDDPHLRVVRQDVFGALNGHAEGPRDQGAWPLTWVEGSGGNDCPVAGIQVHAVAGTEVTPVRLGDRVVGTMFEDANARHCVLGGLRPSANRASPREQTREVFAQMEAALTSVGMTFQHVYRTWFYLENILAWYGEFNAERNAFFRERRLFDLLLPSSTGVGGKNFDGAAVVANLLAIQPRNQRVNLQTVASPLQGPAPVYGSSFSRAVELALPHQRRLYVSGTASIGPDGQTVHIGDLEQQVAYTMGVVAAILNSRQMGWEDVVRAIAYFKDAKSVSAFSQYCHAQRLPELPCLVAENEICRDDLLFELEVDAVRIAN